MSGQKYQFSDFRAEFFFRADGEKATSRAENPSARLGLITNSYACNSLTNSKYERNAMTGNGNHVNLLEIESSNFWRVWAI